jgi:hypothetical protein
MKKPLVLPRVISDKDFLDKKAAVERAAIFGMD